MNEVAYQSKEERMADRRARVSQLVLPMTVAGTLRCKTCNSDKIPSIIEWDFNDNDAPCVVITFICIDTRCSYAKGQMYREKLYLTPAESQQDLTKFRKKLTNIKGVGDSIATKLINAGFVSVEDITRSTVDDLITKAGLNSYQASSLISQI